MRVARYGAAKRLGPLGAVVVALLASSAGPAAAGAIRQNLSPPGCAANTVVSERQAVPLQGFSLEIGGSTYNSLYVNASSGTVTFERPFGKIRTVDPATAGAPVIAPLLATFDTRGGGSPVTYGQTKVNGRDAFCVNWVGVGYYSQHADRLNYVQLLLIKELSPSNDFNIEFNYDQIDWDHGDGPNGQPNPPGPVAAMGYADGAGGFYVHPDSLVNGAFKDSNTSSGLIYHHHGATNQDGRYIFEVRRPSPILSGTVLNSQGDPVPHAPVIICPQGGTCFLRFANSSGVYTTGGVAPGQTYDLTAHPGAVAAAPGHATVTMPASGADQTQNITITSVVPLPPGTTVSGAYFVAGVPVIPWQSSYTVTTQGCAGGSATYTLTLGGVLFTGPMTEDPPNSGTYSVTVPSQGSNHGLGEHTIAITCPNSADNTSSTSNIYIDPSGFVRDSQGHGIPGATVTLYRSTLQSGPFFPVEDGSTVMSPSNRTTPDLTDTTGHFGWNVLPGFYRVRAEKIGCVSNANRTRPFVWSRIMDIPPPVTDLDLRLYCARKTRIQAPASLGTISVRQPAAFVLRGAMAECAPGSPRCTVAVTLTTRGRNPVRLGTVRYRILGARLVPVKARLSPTGRTALAAAARLRVRGAIDIRKGGTSQSRTVRATLKRKF
jgi:hypothetical protein